MSAVWEICPSLPVVLCVGVEFLEETGFAGHICQTIKQCLCKRIICLAIDVSSFNGFAGSERGRVIWHFYCSPRLKKVKIDRSRAQRERTAYTVQRRQTSIRGIAQILAGFPLVS